MITRLDTGLARTLIRGAAVAASNVAVSTNSFATIGILLSLSTLASMGGQGGGGILVPTFMMFDQLDPHAAVPLSKVVVFIGTLSSVIVNANADKDTVDAEVVLALVPTALAGTLIGVALNRITPSIWIISLLSCTILVTLGLISTRLRAQWKEEAAAAVEGEHRASSGEADAAAGIVNRSVFGEPKQEQLALKDVKRSLVAVVGLLICVVLAGTFMRIMTRCEDSLIAAPSSTVHAACESGALRMIFGNSHYSMEGGFLRSTYSSVIAVSPMTVTLALSAYTTSSMYSRDVIGTHHKWTKEQLYQFSALGLLVGILAALVGVGGGMLFAPFMLFMGMDSVSTVMTSTFCVLFTSCSTSMQFLLLGRVLLNLVPVYALVNIFASVAGSYMVILLDRSNKPKSTITCLVLAAQLASAGFCIWKLQMIFSTDDTKLRTDPMLSGDVS